MSNPNLPLRCDHGFDLLRVDKHLIHCIACNYEISWQDPDAAWFLYHRYHERMDDLQRQIKALQRLL